MRTYTIQIPADIYFEIEADCENVALQRAEGIRDTMVDATEFATVGEARNARVYAHAVGLPSIEDID